MAASYLERLEGIPEIEKAVESDLAGNPIAAKGDIDADAVASLMSYVGSRLDQAGAVLGLGPVRGLMIQGHDVSCVALVRGETLISCFLGAKASAVNVQRAVERTLS